MSLLFDANRLDGLEMLEQGKVATALAQILMLAAGIGSRSLTMTSSEPIPPAVLKRRAVVYVRQSSQSRC